MIAKPMKRRSPSPRRRKSRAKPLCERERGEYSLRVSGGTCDQCGFEKLPNGVCGVCWHSARVADFLQETEAEREHAKAMAMTGRGA